MFSSPRVAFAAEGDGNIGGLAEIRWVAPLKLPDEDASEKAKCVLGGGSGKIPSPTPPVSPLRHLVKTRRVRFEIQGCAGNLTR